MLFAQLNDTPIHEWKVKQSIKHTVSESEAILNQKTIIDPSIRPYVGIVAQKNEQLSN